jgi:hypothetical protein
VAGKTLNIQNGNNSVYMLFLLSANSTNNSTWQLYTGTVTSNAGTFSPGLQINLYIY